MTHNGTQIYGLKKLLVSAKIGMHPKLRGLTVKQKLALNYVAKESKITRMGKKYFTNTFTPFFPSPAYDRYLTGVRSIIAGKSLPVITNFAVTSLCPCSCWHCSFSNRNQSIQPSTEELTGGIAQVQELGSSVIGFTGGEPLLREDLEEVIASVDERSMAVMFTTGYELTASRVRGLKKAGLEIPVISLDHHTAEKHDRGRRKEGIFEGAIEAIRLFKEEGFYVAVSFVPDRELVDDKEDLYKTIEFFKSLGINDMRLTSPILSGNLTRKPGEMLTPENVETIFELQRFCTRTKGYPGVFAYDYFESRKFYGCGAGFNYMFIDSLGNISPCDFTMMSFGSMKKEKISTVWERMSGHFQLPGTWCYANKIHDSVSKLNSSTWPLPYDESVKILKEVPSFDPHDLPDFYKKAGLSKP